MPAISTYEIGDLVALARDGTPSPDMDVPFERIGEILPRLFDAEQTGQLREALITMEDDDQRRRLLNSAIFMGRLSHVSAAREIIDSLPDNDELLDEDPAA